MILIDVKYFCLFKKIVNYQIKQTLIKKFKIFQFANIPGAASHHQAVRILYRTRDNFKNIAKALGIMDDFKSGVPRMAYKGVVSTMYRGQRVYVAPNLNWKGYDPSW